MVPNHLIASLATAADGAVQTTLKAGAPGQNQPTGEVGFVAAIVTGGVQAIANAWAPVLRPHGLSVKLSGVFCHQTPMATFTDSAGKLKSCELADLLIVVEENSRGPIRRRWAALIQAKMSAPGGGQTLTRSEDLRQLDLMSRWPPFTLPKNYAPGLRDFNTCAYPGTVQDSGRYGLIEGQPNPDWYQHAPSVAMPAGGERLGSFIAHMVETGQVGYGREATGTADDWSRTVDELMSKTYAQLFTLRSGFRQRQPRGQSVFAFTFSGPGIPLVYYTGPGLPPPPGDAVGQPDDDTPAGISMLRLRISSEG